MVDIGWLALAVPSANCAVAHALYSQDRLKMPFGLLVIGY